MRQCRVCSGRYDDSVDVCPRDGAALDPLLGTILEGKYRLDALLGSGGMGAVYRATQLNLERPVAVKVVHGALLADPAIVARFKREALAVARLNHPHIVAVHDCGVAPGVGAYLVMEYLEGHSLRREIGGSKRLTAEFTLEAMRQICSAVRAAHAAGIVHRDLKPDNILLEATAGNIRVKVLDFGIAKLQESSNVHDDHLTAAGALIGTPPYMSPEQCVGGRLDARSDIYSLGCVLYEMLTGRPPFVAENLIALLNKHLTEPPEPPSFHVPGVSPLLEAVALRALAKQPEDRFPTVADLERALDAFGDPFIPETLVEHARRVSQSDATILAPRARAGIAAAAPDGRRDEIARAPNNLPQQVTAFVGRERDTADVVRLLGTTRLLTLLGSGGIGKTRLSLQVAAEVLGDYPDGVWLVELAPLSDPALVSHAIAQVLGLQEQPGRPLLGALCEFLQTKRLLLVLDNCEHLVEACAATSAALLRSCPHVRLLASSQATLDAAGEVIYRVLPLSVPGADRTPGIESLVEYGAVQLLLARIRQATPDFAPTEQNAHAIAGLCQRLEGIPLAIELAAARAKVLSVEQILARLDDRFRLLTGGSRTAPSRHQTLRATVEWSYSLLTDEEQATLRHLSAFAGGWTLEAAEAVCGEGGGRRKEVGGKNPDLLPPSSSLLPSDVLDLLARLVDRSLVIVDEHGSERRYRMLETIRQFADEKLRASGEEPRLRAAHLGWCQNLAERADAEIKGPDQSVWLARLEAEHDNMRAALQWGATGGTDPDDHLQLCSALAWFWNVRGHWSEGRKWLEDALSAVANAPGSLRAKALMDASNLAVKQCDYARAMALLEESLTMRRVLGDTREVAATLNNLGIIVRDLGDYDRAAALYREGMLLYEQFGDRRGIAVASNNLGMLATDRGAYDEAEAWLERGLSGFRDVGHARGVGNALHNLGEAAQRRGDYERAAGFLQESLRVAGELNCKELAASSTWTLGVVSNALGDQDKAARLYEEVLAMQRELGNTLGIANALDGFACVAAARGRPRRALRLTGAATALREAIKAELSPSERAVLDDGLARARRELDGEAPARAFEEGRTMTLERAITYALEGGQ